MNCKICHHVSTKIFNAKLLCKYDVAYYRCTHCGFLQTEQPYWLEEAYTNSISLADTGILKRNLYSSKIASILIYFLFDKNATFVDFAGGYGILTRLMRDIGFDFYWHDPYSTNCIARGFEFNLGEKAEMVTAFEVFEHFTDPLVELDKMLSISSNILFSTVLLPALIPKPDQWSYYVLEYGQHVSFYTLQTLNIMAKKHNLNLLSNGVNVHLFTRKSINPVLFKTLLKSHRLGAASFVSSRMTSLSVFDMETLTKKNGT